MPSAPRSRLPAATTSKQLRDRYPEIESTCAVAFFEDSDAGTTPVEIGRQKFLASVLYADTTFFRMFDFTLLEGSREEALAARENVVLSESFARKVFGTFTPLGQTLRVDTDERVYVVSGVLRGIAETLSMHAIRVVDGERQINLIFDVVVPFSYDDEGKRRLLMRIYDDL